MKKSNLQLIQARYEAVNDHDIERFRSFYADRVRWRDPGTSRPVRGPRGAGRRLEAWIGAVPNLRWRLDDLFGEGDRLCARFTFTGAHRGPLTDRRGDVLTPSGRSLRIDGVGVYEVAGGKIVDSQIWFDLDAFGIHQMLRP